ncbi:MAG: T9SS type A sorting domain-containing protein [Lewinellaceae bacterium]|nr:T9SS type A sorting domain-containing protein [Lewinellaceae bacterium]
MFTIIPLRWSSRATPTCNGQWAYFTATSGLSNYSWSVVPDANETYSYSGGGAVVNIGNLLNSSWHMVSVSATDCWGTTKYGSKSFWTTQCLTDDHQVADSRDEDHQTDHLQAETAVLAFPNPVSKGGILLLDTGNPEVSVEAYQLFSVDGKLIGSATATALTNIVMPDAAGMYLLILQDSKGELSRSRIIVSE